MEYFKNISYMISHVFLMAFIYLFVTHRYSRAKTLGICAASFMALNLLDCVRLNIFPDSNWCGFLVTILQILVTQSTGLFIAAKRESKVLFMVLSSSNYVIAGSIAASVIHIYTKNAILALGGSIMLHFVILCLLTVRLRKIWLKCYERQYAGNWWELCLIPVFFYCGFFCIAVFPHTLDEYPDNIPGTIIFMLTMFVSYVVVMRYVESESKRSEIYWKNQTFQAYIKGLENQYYLVEQSEKNLKILRHDMRHYSGMIDSLLDQEEYDEIRKITMHINDVADENKVVKYCDNLIVNAILSQMIESADACGAKVCLDLDIPRELPVNQYELASVIANLLENALNCVEKLGVDKRYVRGKVHCNREYLLVHMENECEEKIIFNPDSGLPRSQNGADHGLGMKSVSAFSEKIGGNIGCYCEEGIFQITLFAKF